jgi:6-phosphogluconolactonase
MSADALPGEVCVLTDPIAMAAAAASWLSERSAAATPLRIAVSGGTTPRFLYEALASSTFGNHIDWTRWHVFFGDERAVPSDDARSNYRLLHDALLSKVRVPPGQVHRMEAESADLDAAAAAYAALLETEAGAPPRLDVVLLGIGEDGHTASLFPGTPALSISHTWVTRGRAPTEPIDRITLTLPVLNAAAHVAFLVTGPAKADALRGVIAGSVPAALVRPRDGRLLWFLDAAAARSLD